jgi:hypothetical protein
MFYDQGFRPGLEDILDYLQFNRRFLVPCLDAPISSVVMEDTDSLQMALPTPLSPPTPETKRRSGSWQDKLASAARKTFSVPGFGKGHGGGGGGGGKHHHNSRTFLASPLLSRARSSSLGAMHSVRESLLLREGDEGEGGGVGIGVVGAVVARSTSCLKHVSSPEASERGDSGERGDSDYFSDNSKELCQTITTV